MKLKTQITKCYLVQIIDDEGNELACEYVFTNSEKDARQTTGKELKERVLQQIESEGTP